MSEVGKEWNKLVGESPQAGKLTLHIDRKKRYKQSGQARSILMESSRNYENIKFISVPEDGELLMDLLAKRAGSWKNVSLKTCGSFPQSMWPYVLQIVEPSVEKLSISDLNFAAGAPSAATNWLFPRLQYLNCRSDYHNVLKYFRRVKSLVLFKFSKPFDYLPEATFDAQILLRNNPDLKTLTLISDGFLLENFSEFKFKLQTLEFLAITALDLPVHFCPFLKTQKQTLEKLDINAKLNQTLLELVFGMPKLTSLTIGDIGVIQELQMNSNISYFKAANIYNFEGYKLDSFKILIRTLKGLKRLFLERIDNEMLSFLVDNFPDLESIETNYFNVSWLPAGNIFPKIKSFKAFFLHHDLEEPTSDHIFAKLVRKEIQSCEKYLRHLIEQMND